MTRSENELIYEDIVLSIDIARRVWAQTDHVHVWEWDMDESHFICPCGKTSLR